MSRFQQWALTQAQLAEEGARLPTSNTLVQPRKPNKNPLKIEIQEVLSKEATVKKKPKVLPKWSQKLKIYVLCFNLSHIIQ